MATRVRVRRWTHQPLGVTYSTPGDRQPTALALAAAGRLAQVAAAMGRGAATLFKWSEGERGPEYDLRELFAGLRRAGIPRQDAALLLARIDALFEEAYRDALPELRELHLVETETDTEEDRSQMPLAQGDESLEAQQRHLPNLLAEIGVLRTMAARITRNLQLAGKL